MTTLNRIFLSLIAATTLVASAGLAHAGCNPACPKGQVCRYEAAGGKFYCAKPVAGNGGLKDPATPAGGTVKPAAGGATTSTPSK